MNGEAMYMFSAPPEAPVITGGAPRGVIPISLPVETTPLSDFSTLPQPFGTSMYATCAPLDWISAACGLGSGEVGESGICLTVVTPAALNTGTIWGRIDSPCGLEKYISATLLTPSVLPA